MGVSMLVDALNNRLASGATPTTVEGPFHIPNAPAYADGANMAEKCPGIACIITGTVRGLDGRPDRQCRARPVADRWEGLYEAQRDVTEPWMRGLFHSKADGTYAVRTVAPIGYSIPMDGPVGELVKRTEISEMRPAHIHFCIEAPGYHRVVTHLFRRGCPYIKNRRGLRGEGAVDRRLRRASPGIAPNGDKIDTKFYAISYDFILQPKAHTAAAA